MSNALDSKKLSDIIREATCECVSRTEAFIRNIKDEPTGIDTVTVMLNGQKSILSRESYNLLKEQNDATKLKMKADIKTLTNQFKASKKESQN